MDLPHRPAASAWTAARRLWPSVLLFAVSLLLPAFHWGGHDAAAPVASTPGWGAIVIGAVGGLFGLLGLFKHDFEFIGAIAWFANPLLLACWLSVALARFRIAFACGAAALAVALSFLGRHTLPLGEGPPVSDVVPDWGYRLWILSILAALVRAWLSCLESRGGRISGGIR